LAASQGEVSGSEAYPLWLDFTVRLKPKKPGSIRLHALTGFCLQPYRSLIIRSGLSDVRFPSIYW
jgi:hypothetical protein